MNKSALSLILSGSLLIPSGMAFGSINPNMKLEEDSQSVLVGIQKHYSEMTDQASFLATTQLADGLSVPESVTVQLDQGDKIAILQRIENELSEEDASIIEISVLKRDGTETTYFVDEETLARALTASDVPVAQQATTMDQILGSEFAGSFVAPVKGKITSRYGMRRGRMHYGTDYGVPIGTPVKAGGSGKVVSAGTAGGYGRFVEILHSGGIVTRYGHLSKVLVSCGQTVKVGSLIAKSGNTGRSTGPHLHYEKRSVRPLAKCGGYKAPKDSGKEKKKKNQGGLFDLLFGGGKKDGKEDGKKPGVRTRSLRESP